MVKPKLLVAVAALALLAPGAARASASIVKNGDVAVIIDSDNVLMRNSRLERRWDIRNARLRTILLADVTGNAIVAQTTGYEPDFSITLGGGRLIPSSNLELRSATAVAVPRGVRVTFALGIPSTGSVPFTPWIERTVTLQQNSAVLDTHTLLHSDATPLLVPGVNLEELVPAAGVDAVVTRRYVGGSDWRDDFHTSSSGNLDPFDREGEVLQASSPAGAGFFIVAERRGGAASRVGSDGTHVWAGVDWTRDLEDLGPITYGDPESNHVDNPVYPVPVRARHILPFTTLDLGRTATGVFHGGEQQAAAAYADWLVRYRQPHFPRQATLNSFHPWSHGADFNATTMLAQADVAKSLGIDTVILDDQWQGGPGGESGDWQWDTTRFPDSDGDGKADIVDQFAAKGIKLGLWMSPVEFNMASQTFARHPLWACTPIGTVTSQLPDDAGLGVWDITNPQVQAYLAGVVRRIVRDWGVHYFKFDFQTWVDCPPHDYNDYEQAFVDWVDALQHEHPDVTFEFDETNDQRMWAFESAARGPSWFDNGHDHTDQNGNAVKDPAQLLHDIYSAVPWIPPSTIGAGTYDGTLGQGYAPAYLMPIAALTHITFWTDLTKLTDAQRAETQWWLAWYHANAARLGGVVYNLGAADPWDDAAPAAFQPWDPATGSGFLFAFRQSGDAPVVSLKGLDSGASYRLRNVRTGALLGTFTAAQLQGFSVPLTTPHSAVVYRVTKV